MMEAFIVVLITTIGVCLAIEIVLSKPAWGAIAGGFVPSLPGDGALYLAIGILGATVMPHNLYLHSALVQSRRITQTPAGIRSRGAVQHHRLGGGAQRRLLRQRGAPGHGGGDVLPGGAPRRRRDPGGAPPARNRSSAPRWRRSPSRWRSSPSGQSSTITGTLAGQIVMEGFVQLRLRPVVRRLLTRTLAIIPAVVTIVWYGERATGNLLVLSQVVLSLQLSFAVIPLIHLVSDRRWMGQYAIKPLLQGLAWLVAGIDRRAQPQAGLGRDRGLDGGRRAATRGSSGSPSCPAPPASWRCSAT